jgi:hypothetical protein
MDPTEQLILELRQQAVVNRAATHQLLEIAGFQASWQTRQMHAIRSLADVEFRVHSQWGEDGIIDWLIEHVEISTERFIEFGVENYLEANTRFLLKRRNWRGLVIDRSEELVRQIRTDRLSRDYDLTSFAHFVTRENINALFLRAGFAGAIGLLSIDIDGMDYWVWDNISAVKPDIVVCEYNGAFGDVHPITIPYNPDFDRMKAHHSGWYFGASIKALCSLAAVKGYSLIGTNSAGCNAFFLLDHHFEKLRDRVADKRPRIPRFRVSRDPAGKLNYKTVLEQPEIMALPVERVDTHEVLPLGALGEIYSPEWLRQARAE